MQQIGDIFSYIQENNSIPNKIILTMSSEYLKNRTLFIHSIEQCFLKIMKSMLALKIAPKKQYEIYEKLTEKFFTSLHKNNDGKFELDDIYCFFFNY